MPEHDVRDLRVEVTDDGRFVVVCKCGWRTDPPAKRVQAAVALWQHHRDLF